MSTTARIFFREVAEGGYVHGQYQAACRDCDWHGPWGTRHEAAAHHERHRAATHPLPAADTTHGPPVRLGKPMQEFLEGSQRYADWQWGRNPDTLFDAIAAAKPRKDGSVYIRVDDDDADSLASYCDGIEAATDAAGFDDQDQLAERRSGAALRRSLQRRALIVSMLRDRAARKENQ